MSSSVSRRYMVAGAGIGAVAAAASVLPGASSAHAHQPADRGGRGGDGRVQSGADVAHADDWRELESRRIGSITNPTGIGFDGLINMLDEKQAPGKLVVGAGLGCGP